MAESEKKARRRKVKQKVAVALKHDLETDAIPRITATGRGKIAEKILELAFKNNIKVREDPDLAEVLSALEVDLEIPVEVFAAVAEILSYVYRANGITPPWEKKNEKPSADH
jgi:flagellar biosynthesis protein